MCLDNTVTITLDHIIIAMTLDHFVTTMALDTTVAFLIPLVALLMSLPVMWHNEHIWNFSVLQRVHISSLFWKYINCYCNS
jgi:hypothetical protein